MHAICYNRRCRHHGHHTDVSKRGPGQPWDCEHFSTRPYGEETPLVLEDGQTCRMRCKGFSACPGCEKCRA